MIRLVQDNLGNHFIVDFNTGKRYTITGTGQLTAAAQLYGQAIRSANDLPDEWRQRQRQFLADNGIAEDGRIFLDGRIGFEAAGTAVELFGGPNEMEQVVAGLRPDPLTGQFIEQPQTATTQTDVTFEPTPTVEEVETIASEPIDYAGMVRQLMPWMPEELAQAYADEWAASGDPALAIAAVRQHPRYEEFFPGMRRDDGTLRFRDEAEYLATRIGYEQALIDFGLNPAVFTDQVVGLMEGETSPQEFGQRLAALNAGIVNNAPEVREFFQQTYGLDLDGAASDPTMAAGLLAMAADTDVGTAILDQRIAISQVGGEAGRFGFTVNAAFAEQLANLGVRQDQARQLFGAAQRRLPVLEAMAARHGDPDSTVELEEFTGAAVGGDLDQQRRFERLAAQESSLFSPQTGVFARDRSGLLSGLRQR